jgi:hypothetical protein
VHPRSAPERIDSGYSTNQFADFSIHTWSATLVTAIPGPVILEAFPVPSDHGRRLDNDEVVSPSGPGAGEPEPEDTVSLQQAWASSSSVENDKLLAEGQILCNEVGFLGEKSPYDSPYGSEKEHRHLLYSGTRIGAGVYSDWLKCQNLWAGRGY